MKYYTKSKIVNLKEDFWIKNQYNEKVYFVDNKLLTVGSQFNLLKDNKVIYFVKEELVALKPKFEIYNKDRKVAKIKQKMSLGKKRIDISSIYGDLTAKGDILKHNYNIYINDNIIAQISKNISITDNYYIDINFKDEAFILALIIIIDGIIDKNIN